MTYVVEQGLFYGTSDTTFAPNDSMTRAMVLTVLHRMSGDTTYAQGESWYQDGVNWAMAQGISDGTDLEGTVTREQLIAMLWRYAEEPDGEDSTDLSHFTDLDSLSDWAQTAMVWAYGNGVISGRTDTTLAPQEGATRAEVAALLMRLPN